MKMARFIRNINLIDNCRLLLSNITIRSNPIVPVENLSSVKTVNNKLRKLNIPERPKRPLTGYLRFFKEHRQVLIQQDPNLKLIDIAKQCAADWKQLDNESRHKYTLDYKKELDEFTKKIKQYEGALTDEQKEEIQKVKAATKKKRETREIRKKNKENDRPIRPLGSFSLFVLEQAKSTGKQFKDLLVSLKQQWQEMPKSDKDQYDEKAKNAMVKYEENLVSWEKKMVEEGKFELVRKKLLDKLGMSSTTKKKVVPKRKMYENKKVVIHKMLPPAKKTKKVVPKKTE